MNAANVIPLSTPQPFAYGMSASPAALYSVRVRFGPVELDEADARLSRDGTAVTLAPRPFGLLCALARRLGSLFTKHMLLDDHPGRPRFIETVSRRGYRFIAATTAIPSTAAIASAAPVREIDFSGQPSFNNDSEAGPRPRSAGDAGFSGKRAVVCSIRNVDTSKRETGCVLPQPVFATMEEVLYAHELRLQLRARLLRDAAAPTQRWCVGAD
jgi:DNA-binding winged helix-turn-helix (wHTH) protein